MIYKNHCICVPHEWTYFQSIYEWQLSDVNSQIKTVCYGGLFVPFGLSFCNHFASLICRSKDDITKVEMTQISPRIQAVSIDFDMLTGPLTTWELSCV